MPEPTTSLSAPPSLLLWLLCLASWCTPHPSFVFFTPILALAAVLPILLLIVLLHYLAPFCSPVHRRGSPAYFDLISPYLTQQLWDGGMVQW